MYYELVRHLPASGVGVRGLVAGSSSVACDSDYVIRAFAAHDAPLPIRWLALRRELRRIFLEEEPDLVASHFALYTFPLLEKLRSRPLVFHFHGPWALEGRAEGINYLGARAKGALERTVYRHATRCIVLSAAFRDVLHQDYGVPIERIRQVPGGVDAMRYSTGLTQQEARERLGWPRDRPVVLTVRRLVRRMGLEDLISAMREVRRQEPDVLLLIAGTGSLEDELDARVRSLGLENNVRMLGFVPDGDLPLAYSAADFSVVPTVALEGFGLIAVESLAAGTPVLVTPVGGLPEVVGDLCADMVLTGSAAANLAAGVGAALSGELRLPDAEVCRSYARTRYDWPIIAARTREVYAEVLE